MKNILFINLLFLSLIFFSCSNNNDDEQNSEPTNAQLILGKWYIDSLSGISLSDCVKQSYYDFFEDNTLSAVGFDLDSSDECVASDAIIADYYFTSETKFNVVSSTAGIQEMEIVVLNDTKFIAEYIDSGSGELVAVSFRR